MKRAALLALLLSGCQTTDDRDLAQAEDMCRRPGATTQTYTHNQCVAENFRNLQILGRFTPPAAPQQAAVYSSPAAAVPTSDAPPLQNILPPTVRCQSVPAGMGTVQTICR